ncbi:hypothetical protein GTY41_03655 [Streptomyces sp. SID685]|uniref:hypothetical protein n=1 Tax=Streptomyces sp. SID685 TaxID=2690322 RepID=UPI00136F908D|nr:hypothetical protein [Streptomyces sp. SID685]MYR84061.1 hypothetical protein [Streptomyces sp. SID685]
MPSSARTTASAAWPEGVLARYLTVAGAYIDLRYDDGNVKAKCLGERCPWADREITEVFYNDTDEVRDQKIADVLPILQRAAQAHAEKCRAMPRPTA